MDIIRSRRLGEMVRQARQEQGLTQADVAWRVGPDPETGRPLGETQVSRIEAGTKEVPSWLVKRLTEVLGLDALGIVEVTSGYKPDALRELLDARIKEVAAGEGDFAAKQRARRGRHRRPGPTPPAATTLATIVTTAAALFGPRAEPLVTAFVPSLRDDDWREGWAA